MTDDGPPAASPLAQLTAHIARQSPGVAMQPETQLFFRRVWSRLSAEQRLAGSRTTLPDNAGPLNSQQLVHRALAAMGVASPAYFERFGAYIDALLWIEAASAAPVLPEVPKPRKATRGRRR